MKNIAVILSARIARGEIKSLEGFDASDSGVHIQCTVGDYVYDSDNNVLSTPAYMLATDIAEASIGIENTVNKLVELC